MKQVKGILFDLDGTLLDTLESLASSYNKALEKAGFDPHPVDAYRYFVGNGARKCTERSLGSNASESNIEAVLAEQRQIYESNWSKDTAPYTGVVELLKSLKGARLKLGVLSNKDHQFTQTMISHYFGDSLFEEVQGYEADIQLKPHPSGALKIAQRLGLESGDMALVGDSQMDIQTAIACNMVAIGVCWGFRERTELENAGAELLIESPLALLEHLAI